MKILIIGGTGNISRWFTQMLLDSGASVTLFNRGRTHVEFNGDVRWVPGDRTDAAAFKRIVSGLGDFDCVIDMVGFEVSDALTAVDVFSGRVGQYIFCSTVDVYSKEQAHYPVPFEQVPNASPGFSYAYKKMQMEQIFFKAHVAGRLPMTVIRPAATYSEGVSPLLTCFGRQLYHLRRLADGLPVIVHGDGSSIWVETHAEDVARAFVAAVGNLSAIGRAYNVTGDELMTWTNMYRVVAEELGAPIPSFVYVPSETLGVLAPVESEWCLMNFRYNNIFDSAAAKKDLGYRYTISYREGVRRCLKALSGFEDEETPGFYEAILQRCYNQIL